MGDTPESAAPPEGSIEVRSYELVGATPFTKPAVHNELVFLFQGHVVAAFNGDPYVRGTGEVAYPSISNKDTLRVTTYLGSTRGDDPRNPFKMIASGTVFSGSASEMAEMLGRVADAAHSINDSNIDYIMVSLGFTPQNSNSVLHSLLMAAGFKSPDSLARVWAPGDGRSLLPADFKSPYEGLTAADPMWYLTNHEAREHLHQRLGDLNEATVREKVKHDPDPYADFKLCDPHDQVNCSRLNHAGQLFDPQANTTPKPPTWHPTPRGNGLG